MENISNFFKNKKLLRSRDERMIAGVAGGLARYLNVDPAIVRLGFVALAVCSFGLAAVAYVAAMVIIPEEEQAVEVSFTQP